MTKQPNQIREEVNKDELIEEGKTYSHTIGGEQKEKDLEEWIKQVHEGPCCSHPDYDF